MKFRTTLPLTAATIALTAMLSLTSCTDNAPSTKTAPSEASRQNDKMTAPWQDDARIDDLIAKMTLDEKLAQISCVWFGKADIYNADGSFNPEKMAEKFPHGVGCFARPQDTIGMEGPSERKDINDSTVVRRLSARSPAASVNIVNDVQRWHVENTRLGIPTLFHEEGLHGFQGKDATAFPQSIALAASFDPELAERVYSITAREIRARGVHHVLSPVVDVALDPRWGRIEETFGEDPYLVGQMGLAAVKGFQGTEDYLGDDKVLTTLKHMTGHGQPEGGMNVGPAAVSERMLYEIFFPPFEIAVREGKAASVMASYNEINGIPSHANGWLLNTVLRGEWGFNGAVVADYFAINELERRHHIASDIAGAGELALRAGVDLELPDGVAYYALKPRIESGEIPMSIVDQSVRRILEMKVRGRVFETPYGDAETAEAVTGNEEARGVALEAAIKAPVLLKNEGKILPLDASKYKTIAVIGPNSDVTILGGYSDEPRQTVSILDGLKAKAGEDNIIWSKGVTLTDNRSWWDDGVKLTDPNTNRSDIYKAVAAAQDADLIIVAIGGDESTSREAWSETHQGDRNDITLIGEQKELVDELAKTDKPMVAVVISGRPLSLSNVEAHFDGILYGWILGQETGTAVADLLFGDAVPSGKMPVSVPRTAGQIPAYYYHKPTARRGYAFGDASPLYAFGHGLSYTTFEISEPTLSTATIGIGGESGVSVTVSNTGDYEATEVVQMYIRDEVSTVTRPVKELKGFKRVTLAPGTSETVTLPIPNNALSFYDINMDRLVEPGAFEIMVGNSSINTKSVTLTVE
ncbi:glycoside hydrolase family 3 N-terminal domain-containing protein [Robiginitomaculum antarcticum]|uniref:glycoside hydrolase family 3 N-terminal domain-containing protein n=1 Tax=Robiginitomaculum antarcticum TaxID=437507 RepID=UPI000379AF7B|nr:glycoside hydrolase family 3 N-terminal domain-containing protein [Robiginitomaculum antarcticum]